MATLAWQTLPVATLTIRQFAGGKAVRVVALLSMLPAVIALVYWFSPNPNPPDFFLAQELFRGLFIATLLPVIVLILATGAIGNEIEDQTLPYLTLKPVTRLRIVAEKLLAILVVGTPLIWFGLLVSYLIVFRRESGASENLDALAAMMAASFAGILAYSAVFQLVSLFVARALLAGITYALVWESLLGRYLPGLRLVSIRHYTESIFVGMLGNPDIALPDATKVTTAVVVILAVTVVVVILSAWRLRRFNLE